MRRVRVGLHRSYLHDRAINSHKYDVQRNGGITHPEGRLCVFFKDEEHAVLLRQASLMHESLLALRRRGHDVQAQRWTTSG